MRFGGWAPPTFVARPRWNPWVQWFSTSHGPQKPTYALSPRRASADIWALLLPPDVKSNTCSQQFERHTSSEGSICWVLGPYVLSMTASPAVIRWFASVGSITNGLANWVPDTNGPMSLHVFPPSVVTRMLANVTSEYATSLLLGLVAT